MNHNERCRRGRRQYSLCLATQGSSWARIKLSKKVNLFS